MGVDMYWRGTWGSATGQRPDNYWQLNWYGMAHYEDAMESAGMLCHPPEPTRADWDALPPYQEQDEPPYGGVEHAAAKERITASHRGECPGIPAWKFHTNDGWIVTPPEIRAALAAASRNPPTDPPERWDDWLDYLRGAERHGGFEVH